MTEKDHCLVYLVHRANEWTNKTNKRNPINQSCCVPSILAEHNRSVFSWRRF
jgi:hypothetical protein